MGYRIVLGRGWAVFARRFAIAGTWLFGGGALVAAVFVFSFYTAMRVEMRSTEVVVPELAGLTVDQAEKAASPEGLVLQVVEQRNDPRVASGRILEQMPHPGASVRRGRKVKLVLSLGGKVLTVPNVVGHAAREVAIELRQEGFVPGEEARVYSYDMPEGRVLAQVPPPETSAVPSSRVHRLVSDGPPPRVWIMPDLTGRPRQQVESWLTLAGFRRGAVRRVPGSDRVPGTVVSQSPLAGYPVRSKEIVELAIAD
jgi:beta-lactam-binding protein with PASTA domain